jgi:hypothetical protein
MIRRMLAVAVKELLQLRRDRRTVLALLGMPVVLLLIYGFALSFDVRDVRLAVVDQSRTRASREIVEAFLKSGYFVRVADLDEPGRLRGSLPGQWFELVVGDARAAVARLDARAVAGLHTYMFGDRLHVWLDHPDASRARQRLDEAVTAAAVTPTTVRAIAPSLEDVFIAKLTGTVTS